MVSMLFISCNSNKDKHEENVSKMVDASKNYSTDSNDTSELPRIEITDKELKDLPLYGDLNQAKVAKYYPNITDTIKQLFNLSAQKLDLDPGNGILVGLLYNSAVSAQIFLCTHDKKLNLIDKLYIGMTTDFDDGKSHTITQKIISKSEINFDKVDWGYVKNGDNDIDTIGHEKWEIYIDKNGLIKNKITVHKKMP